MAGKEIGGENTVKSVMAALAAPLIVAAGLMSIPHSVHSASSPLPAGTAGVQGGIPHVPLYPLSAKIAHPALGAFFGVPVVQGIKVKTSPVYRLPVKVSQAEAWYTHAMEQRGFHLLSSGFSSSRNAAVVTRGLEFARGPQNSQLVALTFQAAAPGNCDMQYTASAFSLPKRPASTMIAHPSSVRAIDVVYHPWRYGAPAQDFVIKSREEIDQVVEILNALPTSSPMSEACAADFGQGATLTIKFVNRAAWDVTDNAACETVRIPGAPPLMDVGSRLYQTLGHDRPKSS